MSRNNKPTAILKYSFTAEGEGELTVPEGTQVILLEPDNGSGWLFVQAPDERRGFIPTDFVDMPSSNQQQPPPPPPPGVASSNNNNNDFKQHAASRMSVALPPIIQHASDFDTPNNVGGFIPAQTLSMWSTRDSLFGDGEPRTPIAASRRWYYRDIFGDIQGPFNAEEMKQRVTRNAINLDNTALLEVGSGASQAYEEKPLRAFFNNSVQPFSSSQPLIIDQNPAWYYLDGAKVEQGPFCDAQMREWLDDGYFGASTMVRDANHMNTSYQALGSIFRDPTLAFLRTSVSINNKQSNNNNNSNTSTTFDPSSLLVSSGGGSNTTSNHHNNNNKAPLVPQNSTMGLFDPFSNTNNNSNPGSPFGPGSGRDLLRAAIGGGELSNNNNNNNNVTMEDTLELFDKVGLDDGPTITSSSSNTTSSGNNNDNTTGGSKSSKNKKPPPPIRIYGTPSSWPEFKGIPNYKDNPQQYPTAIYTFFTRPLNPKAGKILCNIRREIDGISALTYNKYTLYLEQGDIPLAVATRHSGPVSTTFEIKLLTSPHEGNARNTLTAAKMEVNFLGTQFLLHNSVAGHQGKARDLAVVLYERNRGSSSKGPRKMKVGIPDIESGKTEFKTFMHGASSQNNMVTSLQAINVQDLIPLLNKPPKWNAAKRSFSLDFGGRVTKPSVKNFQLVDALHDPEHENIVMQHGRVGQDKFTVDVQHPMSILQGFAIALSSLHQKKGVD
jgi:hypothetical protein